MFESFLKVILSPPIYALLALAMLMVLMIPALRELPAPPQNHNCHDCGEAFHGNDWPMCGKPI